MFPNSTVKSLRSLVNLWTPHDYYSNGFALLSFTIVTTIFSLAPTEQLLTMLSLARPILIFSFARFHFAFQFARVRLCDKVAECVRQAELYFFSLSSFSSAARWLNCGQFSLFLIDTRRKKTLESEKTIFEWNFPSYVCKQTEKSLQSRLSHCHEREQLKSTSAAVWKIVQVFFPPQYVLFASSVCCINKWKRNSLAKFNHSKVNYESGCRFLWMWIYQAII